MIKFSNQSTQALVYETFGKQAGYRSDKQNAMCDLLQILASTSSSSSIRNTRSQGMRIITLQPKVSGEEKWYKLTPPDKLKQFKFELPGSFLKKDFAKLLEIHERTIESLAKSGHLYAQQLPNRKFRFWFASKTYYDKATSKKHETAVS